MTDELVLIERRDRIATMTLNRPPMNPMSKRVFFTEKHEPRFGDL
jgi:enoyl-CoA hydratase/carnithine racemase